MGFCKTLRITTLKTILKLSFKDWFEDIYNIPATVKTIHLAGDNDIGGEAEPIESSLLKRHEKSFGPTNEVIKFKNWQFLKVSAFTYAQKLNQG